MGSASRSEKIAEILWNVKQHHPEHLDAICERAEIGLSRRKELLQIGSGRKTIRQSRQATAVRQAKFKAKKKANAAEPPKSEAVTKAPVTASNVGKPTECNRVGLQIDAGFELTEPSMESGDRT
jgi:hypothetical protein